MTTSRRVLTVTSMITVAVALYFLGHVDGRKGTTPRLLSGAIAAESPPKASPVKARARDFYAPNSEDLAPDEMRLIACGTGMPTSRPKQAASCWLLELGNGDKFLFDIGTGSAERIAALQIPYNYLDKLFLSHLHTDHFGDLDALFVGGALSGRQKPLRVWGPSGDTPETGHQVCAGSPVQSAYLGPGWPQGYYRPAWIRTFRSYRVRLQRRERGHLSGERRDDPVDPGDPLPWMAR